VSPADPTLQIAPEAPPPAFAGGPRFIALGEVGRGAMGVVEAWEDGQLGRTVAVKRSAHADPTDHARLLHEAALTARLEHPGIPPVYDTGVDEHGPWYSMRLVQGRTLSEVLAARLSWPDRLALVRQVEAVAQAVASAHARGVVHRDLKPDNVVVGRHGEVTVLDWGVARSVQPDVAAGSIVGTLGFMCPEAARGEPATTAGDVWSLGAMLYVVLAGRPPQPWTGAAARRAAELGEVVPIAQAAPATPPPLRSIVERALSPAAADRQPNAAALAADLAAWIDGARVPSHRYTPAELAGRWLRRNLGAALVGASALVIVVGIGLVASGREAAAQARAALAEQVARSEQARGEAARASALTERARLHVERRELAEAAAAASEALLLGEDPERRGILLAAEALREVALVETTTIPAACRDVVRLDDVLACLEEGAVSAWSPGGALRWRTEGDMRALRAGPGVLLVREGFSWTSRRAEDGQIVGRPPLEQLDVEPVWSTGRGALVFAQLRIIVSVDTHGNRRTAEVCDAHTAVRLLTSSPDGRSAIWVCDPYGPVWTGALGEPARQLLPRLPDERARYASVGWGPTEVAVVRTDGIVVRLDPRHPERRTELVTPGEAAWQVRWTPDGQTLVLERDQGGAALLDAVRGRLHGRLPVAAGPVVDLSDGAVTTSQPGDAGVTLRTWSPRGPGALLHPDGVAGLCLSPDGRHLGAAIGDGSLRLWDTAHPLAPLVLRWQAGVVKGCAFSPGGDLLAGFGVREPGARLFDLQGQPRGRIETALPLRRAAFVGPDVLLPVAFGTPAGTPTRVDGAPAGPVLDRGTLVHDLVATPDGRVAALIDDHGRVALLTDGATQLVELRQAASAGALAISADGRRIVLAGGAGIELFDASPGAPVQPIPGPEGTVSVALSADGQWLAAGTLHGGLYVWRLPEGELTAVVDAHEARLASLRFDPSRLWSAGWDGRVLGWEVAGLARAPGAWREVVRAAWGGAAGGGR
jgi:WD40 repeat protein